ncbi:MAG: SIMPL domain-containing protein [Candidatus Pacebacteria bacterium]|nr:SIMPL domain-containing protein [Candidatus Paceibacterota bacterium]
MNNKIITNLLLGLLVLVLAFGILKTSYKVQMDLDVSEQNNNTITVSGKAERQVVPDTSRISFYVTKKSIDQKEAANYVNKKTKEVVNILKELKIEEKDIKTTNYSLQPEYSWNNGKRNFTGYRVKQNVTIVIRDLEQVSGVLAKVIEQSVDDLNGPNMFIDKLDDIKEKLRSEAILDAKSKAKKLASELGVNLSKIVGFSESGESQNYYVRSKGYTESFSMDGGIEEPEINPGEEKITKSVSITFKIEN